MNKTNTTDLYEKKINLINTVKIQKLILQATDISLGIKIH